MENFDVELTPGNMKAAIAGIKLGSGDLYMVDPALLRVLPDFNARVRNEKYEARVRWIADSIKVNGFYKDKPLTGFVAREGDADVVYVTGGHTRQEAVLLAISEGCPVPSVPLILKPRGTSMEDLTVDLVVGNEGAPLTTYESAIVCKRLIGFGLDEKEIARRLGYSSTQHVENLLLLAGAPLAVRKLVIEEVVSASTAIATLKKHGDKAAKVLADALKLSVGGKVKPANLPEAAFKKAVKKQAPAMHEALTKVTQDPTFALISGDLQTLIAELLAQIDSK